MQVKSLTINANKYVDIFSVAANVVLVRGIPSSVMLALPESQKEILIDKTLSAVLKLV